MDGGRNCPDLLCFAVSWWVYFRLFLPVWIYEDVNHWFLSSSLQMYYYIGLFIASMLSPSSLTTRQRKIRVCWVGFMEVVMQLATLWTAHPCITFIYNWAHIGLRSLAWYFAFVSDKKDSSKTYFLCDCDIEMQSHAAILSLPNTRRAVCR